MNPLDDEDDSANGFAGELGFGRSPAVLVVDVCRAYLDDGSPLRAPVENAVTACARLVTRARQAAVPVLFTRVQFQSGGRDGGLFWRKLPALRVFEDSSPLAEFPDEPAPRDQEVIITKQYASAFFGTSLASTLNAEGIDTLVICGLTTSGCIRATAVDALQHGFRPMVTSDACGDREIGPHEANLFDLQTKYADVLTMEETLEALDGAQH